VANFKKQNKTKEKEKETNQELPVVGGITVTFWLLQLSPIQHSMLQSSMVQF